MTDFPALLKALTNAGVSFIVVGGLAAGAHGSARATFDVDVVYARDEANIDRLVAALVPLNPALRGAPPGLPFVFDKRTVERGLNFTLKTDLGDIDLLGEIAGGGMHADIMPHTVLVEMFETTCRCLNLDKLIEVKRAAGRPKDFEVIAELEAIREELNEKDSSSS